MVLTELSPKFMKNPIKNTNFKNLKSEKINWDTIQVEMKNKLGHDIYESWLKKINFEEELNNYILLSVPTRFIRDWITSRYLDQILKIIKTYNKKIVRIEFKILETVTKKNKENEIFSLS